MIRTAIADSILARRTARFETDVDPSEAIARLCAAVERSGFTMRSEPGLKGAASASYVYLTRQSQVTSGGFKPHFVGRVAEAPTGAVLTGVFSLSWAYGMFFGACALAAAGWSVSGLADWLASAAPLSLAGHRSLALAVVGLLAYVARWQAQRDMGWIGARIERALQTADG